MSSLFTSCEFAAFLKISIKTLHRWHKAGRVRPLIQEGRVLRWGIPYSLPKAPLDSNSGEDKAPASIHNQDSDKLSRFRFVK